MGRNILVTAVGGRSVGSGIVHALTRSSQEVKERWNVIGADADPFAWGLYKTPQSILLPLANASDYVEALQNAIRKYNINAIIPGSEAEVSLLTRIQSELSVPVIANSFKLIPLMMDKFETTEKLKALGLKYIETFPIDKWRAAIECYNFPFIIKPTVGTGGSKGLHLVFSANEIKSLLPDLSSVGQYCIQPYIGNGDDEYTVGVLSDNEGKIIDSIVMQRKLVGLSLLDSRKNNGITYAISTGYSQGFFIKNKKIQTFCEDLALQLNSKGPLNIQLRLDGDDIYVFEIHPRFSGTSTMRADVGFNEPDILLRNVLDGEQFGRLDYQHDVAVIRAFEHVVVPINQMLKP
jgi:carbamoyl-phosphate synthase large subunit